MKEICPIFFLEIEHSTDIQNSVAKFCNLQDFCSRFFIVEPQKRREPFEKVIGGSAFEGMRGWIGFATYEVIQKQYEAMCV